MNVDSDLLISIVFHRIRTLGVAALTLCYVALGIVEAYHIEGPGISTWDIAAASLIITEAGGVVLDRKTGTIIFLNKFFSPAKLTSKMLILKYPELATLTYS